MKKLFPILAISLLSLLIPLIIWGQLDIMDDLLFENAENAEENINLKTLDLYWSADSYVPFGYQGRALPTQGSWVTVSADLRISGGNPKNLKYSWFLDGIFQEAKSGYGKDDFEFAIRKGRNASYEILVKIFNESRTFYIEKSIEVPITNPDMVVYSKNSSQINLPYTASMKTFKVISNKETSFLALPYFFNVEYLGNLEFEWTLGDKTVKDSSQVANVFGLKIINKEAKGLLEETFKVIATNKKQTDQVIQKTIKINIY